MSRCWKVSLAAICMKNSRERSLKVPYDTLTSEKIERFERASEDVIYLLPKQVSYRDVLWTTDNLRKGSSC